MKASTKAIAGLAVVGAIVAAVFIGRSTVDTPTEDELLITPRAVEKRDLSDVLTITGDVRREEIQTINSAVDGKVSSVAVDDGDTVNVGDTLFSLDGRAAVAVEGEFAFFRNLDVGSDGPDVLQLERILQSAGFLSATPDLLFTEETRAALAAWQLDHGYGGATPEAEETITVALSQNGAGYDIGKANSVAFTLGASVPPTPPPPPTAPGSVAPAATDAPPASDAPLAGPSRARGTTPPTTTPTSTTTPTTTPSKPTFQIAVNVDLTDEGTTLTFTITSDIAPANDMTIDLTIGGDATGGQDSETGDYGEIDDSILFPKGATSYTISTPVYVDAVIEDSEDITVGLSDQFGNDTNYIVGPRSEVRVLIRANGTNLVPALTVEASAGITDENGSITFTISSTVESNKDLDFRVQLGGSARGEADYVVPDADEAFTIAAGETSIDVDIQIKADDAVEPDETLVFQLLGGTGYRVGSPGRADLIIESDDLPEMAVAGGGFVREGESTGFIVQATASVLEDTSINYQVGGTANAGSDYDVLGGTVTMKAGTNEVIVPIRTLDDDVIFQPADMLVAKWPARIGTVFVDEGEFVLQGNAVVSLTEPTFSITLSVSASDRAELSIGQKVSVDFEAGGQVLAGTISELDESATVDDAGAESYEGIVTVAEDVAAVDGASVTIDVTISEALGVWAVPVASVVRAANGDELRVINDEGTISRVPITIGLIDDEWVEVKEGLTGTELVVIDVDAAAEVEPES